MWDWLGGWRKNYVPCIRPERASFFCPRPPPGKLPLLCAILRPFYFALRVITPEHKKKARHGLSLRLWLFMLFPLSSKLRRLNETGFALSY